MPDVRAGVGIYGTKAGMMQVGRRRQHRRPPLCRGSLVQAVQPRAWHGTVSWSGFAG